MERVIEHSPAEFKINPHYNVLKCYPRFNEISQRSWFRISSYLKYQVMAEAIYLYTVYPPDC